jgi:hypothetical protein
MIGRLKNQGGFMFICVLPMQVPKRECTMLVDITHEATGRAIRQP